MLVSKFIKTWLIISNEKPSIIKADIINFKVKLIIYNNKGVENDNEVIGDDQMITSGQYKINQVTKY